MDNKYQQEGEVKQSRTPGATIISYGIDSLGKVRRI
jgi:hypothetical protein